VEQRQRQMESDRLGYEVPWLREDRVHVEILYAVTNQDDRDGMFTVGLDGASEFTRYDQAEIAAAFEAAGEDPVLISLVQMKPEELGAGKTFKGTIREDDLHEASLDIDAMGRFMAPFAAVLINRSEVDPVGLEIVPPNNAPECLGTRIPCTGNTGAVFYAPTLIRPALWELTVNFVADRRMRLEFLARVRDDDSRLLEEGQQAFTPDPATFTPEVTMM
jgi:hypothetical protein